MVTKVFNPNNPDNWAVTATLTSDRPMAPGSHTIYEHDSWYVISCTYTARGYVNVLAKLPKESFFRGTEQ